jgi:hypothetical protein
VRLLIVLDIISDDGCVKGVSGNIKRIKDVDAILGYIFHLGADARYCRGTCSLGYYTFRNIKAKISHNVFGCIKFEKGLKVTFCTATLDF